MRERRIVTVAGRYWSLCSGKVLELAAMPPIQCVKVWERDLRYISVSRAAQGERDREDEDKEGMSGSYSHKCTEIHTQKEVRGNETWGWAKTHSLSLAHVPQESKIVCSCFHPNLCAKFEYCIKRFANKAPFPFHVLESEKLSLPGKLAQHICIL